MPIRKRGDTYYVRTSIGGRRIERAAGPRQADARELETKLQQANLDARLGRVAVHTINEAFVRWLKGEARALKSYANLCDKVDQVRKFTAGRPLSEAGDVAQAIIEDGLARKKPLSPATINRRLAALRRVCRLAVEWGWISHAPTIKLLPGEQAREVMLTELQLQRLMLACEGRVRDAILLGAYTGLREGEILRLTAAHLVDGALVIQRGKTKPRIVPLPQRALPIAQRLPLGITYQDLRTGFEAARVAAEMPHVQFRDLRRTYGSWIVQRTGSLKAAQDLLGHTTPTITSRHYAFLLTDHLRDAVATLDAKPAAGQKWGKDTQRPGGTRKKNGA